MDLDARALLAGMTDLRFSLEVTSESNEQNDQDNKMDLVLNLISKVFFTLVGILFYTSAGEGPTDFCPVFLTPHEKTACGIPENDIRSIRATRESACHQNTS